MDKIDAIYKNDQNEKNPLDDYHDISCSRITYVLFYLHMYFLLLLYLQARSFLSHFKHMYTLYTNCESIPKLYLCTKKAEV